MIIGSKNKGDWSELYVLLYLLDGENFIPQMNNLIE